MLSIYSILTIRDLITLDIFNYRWYYLAMKRIKSMVRPTMFILIGLLIGLFLSGLIYGLVANKNSRLAAQTVQTPPTRDELLKLVNAERAKVGVAPLTESPLLDQSAQWKADDEVTNGYFGHVKPGTTGNDGLDYLNSLHPQCTVIDENLIDNVDSATGAVLDNTSAGSVSGWVKSPVHYKAMINSQYTTTGFGINGTEVVEHFCQP